MVFFYRWQERVVKSTTQAVRVNGATLLENGPIAFPVTWLRTDAFPIFGSYPEAVDLSNKN